MHMHLVRLDRLMVSELCEQESQQQYVFSQAAIFVYTCTWVQVYTSLVP